VVDRRLKHEAGAEPADAPESREEYPTYVEQLLRRTEEAERTLGEYRDAYKKEKEELDAVRRRLTAEVETRAREAVGRSFGRFLEVIDNLDLALGHASQDDPLREGVERVRDQLLAILESAGLERIAPQDLPFDPHEAEAVMTRAADREMDGMVLEVIRCGYRHEDKVVRPAQVVVGRHED
jgi:molecular chaperone GrpE